MVDYGRVLAFGIDVDPSAAGRAEAHAVARQGLVRRALPPQYATILLRPDLAAGRDRGGAISDSRPMRPPMYSTTLWRKRWPSRP